MIRVTLYLLVVGTAYLGALACLLTNAFPILEAYQLPLVCAATGGLGGCLYCLRAVYLNACVRKQWDSEWYPWYFIRPLLSAGCGAVSYLFLRTGLLVLESNTVTDASEYGFYALAFIAGLNVDKFLKKIEDISEAVWGIEKSRTQKQDNRED